MFFKSLILTLAVLIAVCGIAIAEEVGDTDQTAIGTVVNSQDVDQTVITNNNQADQDANGVIVGNDNTQVVINDNSKGNSVTNNVGGTSVTYGITYEAAEYTYHDLLDKPQTNGRILSVYSGRALVYPLNFDGVILKGEMYNITYKSACPMLVYVVNTLDKDKVNLKSSAPIYDDIVGGFDHQALPVIKGSIYDPEYPDIIKSINPDYATLLAEDLSTQNEIIFTLPEDGKYSVVFDTRPSQHRNGLYTKVLDSTCDIAFMTGYAGFDGDYIDTQQTQIGETSIYPVDSYGHIITT